MPNAVVTTPKFGLECKIQHLIPRNSLQLNLFLSHYEQCQSQRVLSAVSNPHFLSTYVTTLTEAVVVNNFSHVFLQKNTALANGPIRLS